MDEDESIDEDEPLYFYRHGVDGEEEGPEPLSRIGLFSRARKRALFVRRADSRPTADPSPAVTEGARGPYRTASAGAPEDDDEGWVSYERMLADAREGAPDRWIGDATIAAIRPLVFGALLVVAGVGLSVLSGQVVFVGLVIAGIVVIVRALQRWVNGEV